VHNGVDRIAKQKRVPDTFALLNRTRSIRAAGPVNRI
jgi:hypothetical protein